MSGRRKTGDILDQLPPHSREAEQGVLGSILLVPDCLDDVAVILRPTMFYDEAHDILFSAMIRLNAEGKPIDPVLLKELLGSEKQWEKIGGLAYISELVNGVPHAASAMYYAGIVRDMAMKRGLLSAATEILRRVSDNRVPAPELLSFAEEEIGSIHANQAELSVRPIAFTLAKAERRLDQRKSGSDGMGTGFRDVDEVTSMRPGEFIVLAARPGQGKSTLALNIAANVSRYSQGDILFVSCEMSPEEITDKLIASEGNLSISKIIDGTLDGRDRQIYKETALNLMERNIYLDVPRSRRASDVVALARRQRKRSGNLSLVIIDYLQLLAPEAASERRGDFKNDEVAAQTRILKLAAQELQVPILCLSQLNRTGEKTGERPRLHHLRDSGAIEQDADRVWFIHRPGYYKEADRKQGDDSVNKDTFGELIIAKQRMGKLGIVMMKWIGALSKFANFSENSSQPYIPFTDDDQRGSEGVDF